MKRTNKELPTWWKEHQASRFTLTADQAEVIEHIQVSTISEETAGILLKKLKLTQKQRRVLYTAM